MAQVKKSISISEQQDAWIKSQIATGDYASDSEVIRNLIRKEQNQSKSDFPEGFIEALDESIARSVAAGIKPTTHPVVKF